MAKFGNCSQIAGDPPTLAYLGILNCYFFIGYLGLLDHEMDFEINLFFSFTKVSWHLEKFIGGGTSIFGDWWFGPKLGGDLMISL